MANGASGRVGFIREELSQAAILSHHFFGRLFRNDVVDFEDQMKERLIALLSIMAVLIGWGSYLILAKYLFIPDNHQSWQEKTYIFTLTMVLFGIITVLEWDVLFPDRRDFINLTSLPIRFRTLFCAKLTSLVMFVGLFSIAMNSIASFIFAYHLADWRSKSLFFAVRYVVAHILSAFAAYFSVFFACIFLQAFLLAILPHKVYRGVSSFVRLALIATFVFFLLALIARPSLLGSSFNSLGELKDQGAPFIFRFPPLWFAGLYEVLLGTRDAVFFIQARTAGLALLSSLAAFVLASGMSYYRHVLKTQEADKRRPRLSLMRENVAEIFRKVVFRSPEETAVAGFFAKTIRSSPKHRMTLTNYLAVAAGFILLFAAVNWQGSQALSPRNMGLLAQPLILSIILLIGIRAVVGIPAAPEARWVFQVTETTRRTRYVSGLKKAIFLKWFLPLSVLVFLSHLLLWADWRSAFNHAIFGLTISGMAIETAFFRFDKIPFACMTVPGKSRLQTRGVFYVVGFIACVWIFSLLDKELLRDPANFIYFFAFAGAYWFFLRFKNAQYLKTHPLIFEEELEPALISLSDEF